MKREDTIGFDPDLVVTVDWSAASTPKPKSPSPDACWIAWAFQRNESDLRPPPEYFRTRAECEARLVELLSAHAGSAIVGFDFPLGYPVASDGSCVLPVGRELCAYIDSLIEDDHRNANNRFEVAALLNTLIADRFDEPYGPFWGCPHRYQAESDALRPTKRVMRSIAEYRVVEHHIRTVRRLQIQSTWKLYTTGSVGSQTLLGLPTINRLLAEVGERARLWPFESIDRPDAVLFAEIWPSLYDTATIDHPIKDARQVVGTRDALLKTTMRSFQHPEIARQEGWILSVPFDLRSNTPDAERLRVEHRLAGSSADCHSVTQPRCGAASVPRR